MSNQELLKQLLETSKISQEQYNELIANQKTQQKEFSEVFYSKKEEGFSKYKNLSETKKYFEANHINVLKAYMSINNKESLTSQDFHMMLDSIVNKHDAELLFIKEQTTPAKKVIEEMSEYHN